MKTSKLIQELKKIENKYGDLECGFIPVVDVASLKQALRFVPAKKKRERMDSHLAHRNWPNCDMYGCGDDS